MVTKIIAHNFQSHKHTEVDFRKGLSVFVGDSDQGKTALVKRAFLWCLFNEPNGNAFVRYKDDGKVMPSGERERETTCYVTVQFDNGYELTRKREKNKNIYELINEDGEILSFESFKNEVPTEIQEAIGIRKFIIDDDLKFNVNIIGSRDTSLVDLTGSIKSKVIGSFAGTNIIDIANRGVVADIKSTSGLLKSVTEEKENIQEKLKKYDNIPAREAIISDIEELTFEVTAINDKKSKIISLFDKIKENNKRISELNSIIATEKELPIFEIQINECEELIASFVEKVRITSKIQNVICRFRDTQKALKEANVTISSEKDVLMADKITVEIETEIEKVKNVSDIKRKAETIFKSFIETKQSIAQSDKFIASEPKLIKYEKKVLDLEVDTSTASKSIENIDAKRENVLSLFKKYNEQKSLIAKKDKDIMELNTELKEEVSDYVDTIKSFGTCPTCMQPITEEHLKNIENELYE